MRRSWSLTTRRPYARWRAISWAATATGSCWPTDGEEGIAVFRSQSRQIDLVILDMVMPKRGGRETFLELQEINPGVRVLFSTGYSQNGKVNEILALGVKGFIQKPYQIRDLLAKVREILDGKS